MDFAFEIHILSLFKVFINPSPFIPLPLGRGEGR